MAMFPSSLKPLGGPQKFINLSEDGRVPNDLQIDDTNVSFHAVHRVGKNTTVFREDRDLG